MVRVLMNPRKRRKSRRRSSPPSSTSKRRSSSRRRRNPFGKRRRSKRRRNPFGGGGGGILSTATKGVAVVGGMLGSEFLARVTGRFVPGASNLPFWVRELLVGLGGAWLAKKVGFGRVAAPLALGGVVVGLKDLLASKQINGSTLALRAGLGDYMTSETALSGAEYGILGIGESQSAELLGMGLGDYVTGEPAWAES